MSTWKHSEATPEVRDLRHMVVEVIYIYCYGEKLHEGVADERLSKIMEELDKIRGEP